MSRPIFLLGILPAVLLILFIWRKDKIEKEPPGLLVKLFLFGALTTVSAFILEIIGELVFGLFFPQESTIYCFLFYFIAVAGAEEAGKHLVLRLCTWKHPAFDYTFDAVVYAVVTSLGFATLENLLYLLEGSFSVALMRAVLSVPGHAIFALFMGLHYGLAKRCEIAGDGAGCRKHMILSMAVPVLLHGFYDFCLSIEYDWSVLVFFAFEIVVTVIAFITVNRLSKTDAPLGPHLDLRMPLPQQFQPVMPQMIQPVMVQSAPQPDRTPEIKKLRYLRDEGVITQEEFEQTVRKLFGR